MEEVGQSHITSQQMYKKKAVLMQQYSFP